MGVSLCVALPEQTLPRFGFEPLSALLLDPSPCLRQALDRLNRRRWEVNLLPHTPGGIGLPLSLLVDAHAFDANI